MLLIDDHHIATMNGNVATKLTQNCFRAILLINKVNALSFLNILYFISTTFYYYTSFQRNIIGSKVFPLYSSKIPPKYLT